MKRQPFLVLSALSVFLLAAQQPKERERQSRMQDEEVEDYYKKWLNQDVAYIISDEEKNVFSKLTTDEERDAFIEQFWFRRDPDPRTSANEFKEEHYRRIAYANEKFGSGIPGWKTDRGQTYITFGPPDIIEDHPSGGWYYRKHHEGGGATSTYPFQLWIYNYIEGIGDEVEIEFVDRSWSGEYRMALEQWEKDALLHVGFMGPTDLELEGRMSKTERPYFSPGTRSNTRLQGLMGVRAKDKPFQRLARFYQLQKPEPISFDDLKQVVRTAITYNQLPFRVGYEYVNLDAQSILVPVTLELENRNLTFTELAGGQSLRGQLNIYGVVEGLTGRIVTEFEDTLTLEFPAREKDVRTARASVYQKSVLLTPGRYKMTLVVKDDASGRLGTAQIGLVLPALREEDLNASSVILARVLQFLERPPEEILPFVLGDFKVVPNVTRTFSSGDDIGVYLQVYNSGFDQSMQQPQVEVEYQISREGKVVKSFLDPKRNSVLNYGDRLILLQAVDLEGLAPGLYTLRVKVRDRILDKALTREADFTVAG